MCGFTTKSPPCKGLNLNSSTEENRNRQRQQMLGESEPEWFIQNWENWKQDNNKEHVWKIEFSGAK